MKKIFLLLFAIIIAHSLIAQNGITHFNQFFAGIDNKFSKSIQTNDGGYIAIHQAYSSDALTYLIKFNSNLDTTWTINLNPSVFNDVIQLTDGSYILCGESQNRDLEIIRISQNGATIWDKTFGGSGYELGSSITKLTNGNILILGTTTSTDGDIQNKNTNDEDVLLLEVLPTGVIVNQKLYGGSDYDEGISIVKLTNDQGFIFAARSYSNDGMVSGNHGMDDFWVARIDNNYNLVWGTCIGGSGVDNPMSLAQNSDSTLIVVGSTGSTDGDFTRSDNQKAGGFININLSGNKIWSKTIGSNTSTVDLNKVIALGNGSFLMCGNGGGIDGLPEISYAAEHDINDGIVYKMNFDGSVVWNRCIGGSAHDRCYDIIKNNVGNYIICGERFLDSKNGDFVNFPYINGETKSFILELKELNTIKGFVYVDSNNNRIKDPNEDFFIEGFANATKPALSMQSNLADGKFLFGVDTGKYSTSVYFNTTTSVDSSQFRIFPFSVLSNIAGSNQTDTMSFRLVPISYLEEMEITSLFPDSIPTGLNFPVKIYFKNNLNKLVDSVRIKIRFNPAFSIVSSTPSLNYNLSDTSIWIKYNLAALAQDSISLVLKSNLPPLYGPVTINGIVLPFQNDYDTTNNRISKNIFISGQNSSIKNPTIDITSTYADVGKGGIIPYKIKYNFESPLDTTKGVVKLIKDHKSAFISSIPSPTSVTGDTLLWNFSSSNRNTVDIINLNLLINDSLNVHLGDTIKHLASIRFFTQDTFALKLSDTIQQRINVVCTTPDLTNTSLNAPQGIQWLRTLGGNADEWTNSSALCNDTSFVIAGFTNSIDGDFFPAPFDSSATVVKYNTNGNILWKKLIGGNKSDMLFSIQKNTDGSFIATGDTESNNAAFSANHGNGDAWIIKLDSAGNTVWQKILGGSQNDHGKIIRQTADGGYIFLGTTNSKDGDVINAPFTSSYSDRTWVVKLNASGNITWQQFFPDTTLSEANDIIQTLDSGYIIAGAKSYDDVFDFVSETAILKMDTNGNRVFFNNLSIPGHLYSYNSILQIPDSSFVLTGNISKSFFSDTSCIGLHNNRDLLISKIDKNGNNYANKYYGGNYEDGGLKIIKSNDGGYLVAGYTNSFDGNVTGFHSLFPSQVSNPMDGWILKLDSAINIVWQKTIGGDGFDQLTNVLQFPDNNIIVNGMTSSTNNGDIYNYKGGPSDVLIAKIGAANYIRGYVFADQNNDGVKQPAEPYFNTGSARSDKGLLTSASNISQGYFANSVDTGIYITKVIANNNYYSSNPIADTSKFSTYLQTDTLSFAMVPKQGINDLRITLIPLNAARPGFATHYQLKYENIGTTVIFNGSAKLIIGNRTVFDSASVAPTNILSDTLSWNFTSLSPLESQTIIVHLRLLPPPKNNIGDTLAISANISPLIQDTIPLNNESGISQPVVGSFDPNLKIETHGGTLTNDQILDGEFLNYVIYFQNTGNDTAFRVIVRDTLSNKLDWQSFEMISTSHPYILSIKDSSILEWKFDPIILADSIHNEIESHGFVAFKIKPKSNISAGNLITNRASIYFDFNLPVETNTTQTSVSPESSICPGSNTYFTSGLSGNHTYQWQVNDGGGYTSLNNNGVYSGVNNDTLILIAPPTSNYGYQYQCLIDGNLQGKKHSLKFAAKWKGLQNSAWENPANWNCGTVPDDNTDVIINSGLLNYPEININSGCRSIKCKPGSYVLIKAGIKFILKGK